MNLATSSHTSGIIFRLTKKKINSYFLLKRDWAEIQCCAKEMLLSGKFPCLWSIYFYYQIAASTAWCHCSQDALWGQWGFLPHPFFPSYWCRLSHPWGLLPGQVSCSTNRISTLSRACFSASRWVFEMHQTRAAGFVCSVNDKWSKYWQCLSKTPVTIALVNSGQNLSLCQSPVLVCAIETAGWCMD